MRHGDHLRQSMLHENNLYPWEPILLAKQKCQGSDEGQTSWYEILSFRMLTSQALLYLLERRNKTTCDNVKCTAFRNLVFGIRSVGTFVMRISSFFLRLGIEWNWSSLATQQMGRTRKRCEGHAKHKKAANEEVKNSRAVTGVVTLFKHFRETETSWSPTPRR